MKFVNRYTLKCFEYLKQYRPTGFWKVHVDEFRSEFDVPKEYSDDIMEQQILKVLEKELPEYYNNFSIKRVFGESIGRERPEIEYLEFYFDKEH